MAITITWNREKERRNRSRHGLDFSFASAVFANPLAVTVFDRIENGEERWHTMAAVGDAFQGTAGGSHLS